MYFLLCLAEYLAADQLVVEKRGMEDMDIKKMGSYSKEWKEANNMAGLFQKIVEDCKVFFA